MSEDDRKDGISYMEYIRGSQELVDNINAQIDELLSSSPSWSKADVFLVITLQQQQGILFSQLTADMRIYQNELDAEFTNLITEKEAVREQLKSRFLKVPSMNNVSEFDFFNENTKHLLDAMFAIEEAQDENNRKRSEWVVFLNEQKEKSDKRLKDRRR